MCIAPIYKIMNKRKRSYIQRQNTEKPSQAMAMQRKDVEKKNYTYAYTRKSFMRSSLKDAKSCAHWQSLHDNDECACVCEFAQVTPTIQQPSPESL